MTLNGEQLFNNFNVVFHFEGKTRAEREGERGLGAALLPWSDSAMDPFPAWAISSEQLFSSVKTLQRFWETDALVTGPRV